MKLTKRILVVALMLAVLVSVFAFASSAEFTEDNIDDILEYYYPKYVKEDFDSEKLGGYCYPLDPTVSVVAKTTGAKIEADPFDATNKYLFYKFVADNADPGYFGYDFSLDDSISEAVFTTKVYTEKRTADAIPSFSVNISAYDKNNNPVGEASLITPLTIDFETGKVYYAKASTSNPSRFSPAIVEDIDFAIEEVEWYTVTLVLNAAEGFYRFSIESAEGELYESQDLSLGNAKYIDSLNTSYATFPATSGAMCAMDNIEFYRGSALRDDKLIGAVTDETLVGIAALIENGNLDFEAKLKIVEVYDAIFSKGYVPTEPSVFALYESAKLYRAEVYTEIFCKEVTNIDTGKSYARRQDKIAELEEYISKMNGELVYIDIIDTVITDLQNKVNADYNSALALLTATADIDALNAEKKKADEAFAAYRSSFEKKEDATARVNALNGVISSLGASFASTAEKLPTAIGIISENEAALSELRLALQAYKAEIKSLDVVKKDSEGFIEFMKSFDIESRDYTYLLDSYAQVLQFKHRDNSYNYASDSQDCVYYYIGTLEALEAKIAEMDTVIGEFMAYVDIMKNTENDFETRFEVGYLGAKAVYNDGKIYDGVDVVTVPNLADYIAKYLEIEASFSVTINACENFIDTVNSAMFNTLYETKKVALAEAKALLDIDKNINDAYPGVKEAKDLIATVEADILALEQAASKYVAAVAEIGNKTTFNEKKAAINNAAALQSLGNVVGFAGVAEANSALANYSAEIQILEGNSKTFIESVYQLDNEELTLSELRALIIVADGVKAGAEPTYDGVAEAMESLAAHKEAYKSSVEAINSAFAGEIANVTTIAGASVNQSRYYSVMELVKLIFTSIK